MYRTEQFRRDTLDESYAYLTEVLKTMDYKDLHEIIITPMRRDGEIVGYETTVRWIDRSPAWR